MIWNPLPRCCLEPNPECFNNNCWPNPTGHPSRSFSYVPTGRLPVLACLSNTEDDGAFSAFFANRHTAQYFWHLANRRRSEFVQEQQAGQEQIPIPYTITSPPTSCLEDKPLAPCTIVAVSTTITVPLSTLRTLSTSPVSTSPPTPPIKLDLASDEPIKLERTRRTKGQSRTTRKEISPKTQSVLVRPGCVEPQPEPEVFSKCCRIHPASRPTSTPAPVIPAIQVIPPTPLTTIIEAPIHVPLQDDLLSPITKSQDHPEEVNATEINSTTIALGFTQTLSEELTLSDISSTTTAPVSPLAFSPVEIPWNRLIVLPLHPSLQYPAQVAQPMVPEETLCIVSEPITPVRQSKRLLISTHSSTSSIESLGPITPVHDSAFFSSYQPKTRYPHVPLPLITDPLSQDDLGEDNAMDIDVYEFHKAPEQVLWVDPDAMEIDSDLEYSSDSSDDVEMGDEPNHHIIEHPPSAPFGGIAPPIYGLPFQRPTTLDHTQDVRMVSDPMFMVPHTSPPLEANVQPIIPIPAVWSRPNDCPPTPPLMPAFPELYEPTTQEYQPAPTSFSIAPPLQPTPFQMDMPQFLAPPPPYESLPNDISLGPIPDFERMLAEAFPLSGNRASTAEPPAYSLAIGPSPTTIDPTTPIASDAPLGAPFEIQQPPTEPIQHIPSAATTITTHPTATVTPTPDPIHVSVHPGPKETPTQIAPPGLELKPLGGAKYNSTSAQFAPGRGKRQCTTTNLEEAAMNGTVTVPTAKKFSAATKAQVDRRRKERQAKAGEQAQRDADSKHAAMFHNTSSAYYHKNS